MKLEYLYRGFPGHPLHPPLTDATIGIYTFAAIAAVLSKLGIAEESAAKGWALALIVGLIVSAATSATGLIDWLRIQRGTPLFRTATSHGYGDATDGVITDSALILTLIAFGLLTLGGWLGGAIVFNYGMRVLNLVEEPASRAVSPVPEPEEEAAEK